MLRNVIARRTGALPGKAVLIVAHHDTVAASPGAGDDGMGVAITLELADALNVDPWAGRDVIILITDGEEAGLLGAKHFAENHRWMADVGCVLNIDHRGNGMAHIIANGSATKGQAAKGRNWLINRPTQNAPCHFRDAGKAGIKFDMVNLIDRHVIALERFFNRDHHARRLHILIAL
ncbi:MAG: M28 family peptidase [Sphingomonadaceae bacterium]|nr:M28 family peptidase [Sphingomonadaceae bacterium]